MFKYNLYDKVVILRTLPMSKRTKETQVTIEHRELNSLNAPIYGGRFLRHGKVVHTTFFEKDVIKILS